MVSLPLLPHPVHHIVSQGVIVGFFNAAQMQAYGQVCRAAAERDALASLDAQRLESLRALEAERNAALAQIETMTKDPSWFALKAERDALAADAARYRWWTEHIVSGNFEALEKEFAKIGEEKESITQVEFDAVIDAAIKEAGVQ